MHSLPVYTRQQVEAARPPRLPVDPHRPYAWLMEQEYSRQGHLEATAVVFLTNRECPLRCVMCDLWKYTLLEPTPPGAIVDQLDYVLPRLSAATQIKLYNSGNFFDGLAVPPADYPAIARRLNMYRTVIVENHPRFCGTRCLEFRQLLPADTCLEIAMGLEIADDQVLAWLQKEMTVRDFCQAAHYVRENGMYVRAFILLGLPGMDERQAIEGALRTVDVAVAAGADVCSVIAVRGGNGIMDQLAEQGHFRPPRLAALEVVVACALSRGNKRVFADLWGAEQLAACPRCHAARLANLQAMNADQQPRPPVRCPCSPSLAT